MNATVNVVNLTAVMPGDRPIAQLYTDSGTAVDRAVREKDRQSAAKILKRTSSSRRISGTRRCQNTIDRVASAAVNCIARNSPQANRHPKADSNQIQLFTNR